MCAVLILLYFTLPDYPTKNNGLTYFNILFTMAKFAVTEPLLIQAMLVSFASANEKGVARDGLAAFCGHTIRVCIAC